MLTGQCLCGSITYALAKLPQRSTICYCTFCQRATGSTHMILPVLARADLTVTRGMTAIHDHVSGGSGKTLHINFCADCGTKLFVTFERWPANVGLYSGTLDQPGHVTLDPANTKQIFASEARPGTILYAGIPTYWQHATDLDGNPQPSFVLDTPKSIDALRAADRTAQ